MKKFFALAVVAALSMGTVAFADTVIQDFEAGTDATALPGNWAPHISGSSTGYVAASDAAIYSSEQAHAGTLSGKLTWTWSGTTGFIRIQPAVGGVIAGSDLAVDRSAEPYISAAIYGANQQDNVKIYMGEADNGGSTYEAFPYIAVTWTGWEVLENNINDPVVGWATGDGTLNAACSFSGFQFQQQAQAASSAQTYYVDDIQFTATSVGTVFSAVEDWSVY